MPGACLKNGRKEREAIQPHLQDCDAVILTALVPGEEAPLLINEDMVKP